MFQLVVGRCRQFAIFSLLLAINYCHLMKPVNLSKKKTRQNVIIKKDHFFLNLLQSQVSLAAVYNNIIAGRLVRTVQCHKLK